MENFTEVFRNGISESQLNEFITAVVDIVDDDTMNDVLSILDNGIRKVYRDASNPAKNKSLLFQNKFENKFEALLLDIGDFMLELGDEQGNYFGSEHHWECPEFNEYEFSDDIEEVFKKMLPLLDDAYKYETIEENYFISLIYDIEDGISSYPDWSGAEYNEWCIEKNGAEVILKWLWLNKKSVGTFIVEAFNTIKGKNITNSFEPSFIQNLTDHDKEKLYLEIKKHSKDKEWKDALDDTSHFLHNIFHFVTQIGNPDGFIEESIENITQKWHYGIPVYEYYFEQNDYQNAEKYIQQTFKEF
ncbi:MAG: hypothetical protein U9O87_10630 [Verrucomicrobiota bacterium]|nr:hypothetical protein [Verrucomicrobiota bacterium]